MYNIILIKTINVKGRHSSKKMCYATIFLKKVLNILVELIVGDYCRLWTRIIFIMNSLKRKMLNSCLYCYICKRQWIVWIFIRLCIYAHPGYQLVMWTHPDIMGFYYFKSLRIYQFIYNINIIYYIFLRLKKKNIFLPLGNNNYIMVPSDS